MSTQTIPLRHADFTIHAAGKYRLRHNLDDEQAHVAAWNRHYVQLYVRAEADGPDTTVIEFSAQSFPVTVKIFRTRYERNHRAEL